MPEQSDDVIRARFARFVEQALAQARTRGMTDQEIYRLSGVTPSAFHRWKRGAIKGVPTLDKVRAFCRAIGVDAREAMTALGMSGERDNPAPEAPMPPELRRLLRKLADPNVPVEEKNFIRETFRMLANRPERPRHRRDLGQVG